MRFIYIFIIMTQSFGVLAATETRISTDFRPTDRLLMNQVGKENVDYWTGDLTLTYSDFELPTSGGMNIEVNRIYSLSQSSSGMIVPVVYSYDTSDFGPGWKLSYAPKIVEEVGFGTQGFYPLSHFSLTDFCSNKPVINKTTSFSIEHKDGRREKFYLNNATGSYITKSLWKFECNNNNIYLHSPKGEKFSYGNYKESSFVGKKYYGTNIILRGGIGELGPQSTEFYMLPQKKEDSFGNWIKYEYEFFGKPIRAWWKDTFDSTGFRFMSSKQKDAESPSLKLKRIFNSDGVGVDFNYSASTGKLTYAIDSVGKRIDYGYQESDKNNNINLISVDIKEGPKWKFSYYTGHYPLITQTPTNLTDSKVSIGKLKTVTNPYGGVTEYQYTYFYKTMLKKVKHGDIGFSKAYERVKSIKKPNGDRWLFEYESAKTGGKNDVTIVKSPENTVRYTYQSQVYNSVGGGYSNNCCQNYGWKIGRLLKKEYSNSDYELYEYEPIKISEAYTYTMGLGNVVDKNTWIGVVKKKTIFRDGIEYITIYDDFDQFGSPRYEVQNGSNGSLKKVYRSFINDIDSWIIGLVSDEVSGDDSIQYEYNKDKVKSVNRNGLISYSIYNSIGNKIRDVDPEGNNIEYSDFKFGIPQITKYENEITKYSTVDEYGRVTSRIDGEGNVEVYKYDVLSRLINKVQLDKNRKNSTINEVIDYEKNKIRWSKGEHFVEWTIGPSGEIAKLNDNGLIKSYKYDSERRIIYESYLGLTYGQSTKYDLYGRKIQYINADNTTIKFEYNKNGMTIQDEKGNSKNYIGYRYTPDDELQVTNFSDGTLDLSIKRDLNDRVLLVSNGIINRKFDYDDYGFLLREVNPETGETLYETNKNGKIISKVTGDNKIVFNYDNRNRLTGVNYGRYDENIEFTYDKNDRKTLIVKGDVKRAISYDYTGNVVNETMIYKDESFTSSYSYDEYGFLEKINYPIGNEELLLYPDEYGRPQKLSGIINHVEYFSSGLPKTVTFSNGVIETFKETLRRWINRHSAYGKTNIFDTSFYYDKRGSLIETNDTYNSKFTSVMGYDESDRIISFSGYYSNEEWVYDDIGNITYSKLNNKSVQYAYNYKNQIEKISNDEKIVEYDVFGNMSKYKKYNYDFGCDNLLDKVWQEGISDTSSYLYDGLGNRIATIENGNYIFHFYDHNGLMLSSFNGEEGTNYYYLGRRIVGFRDGVSR